MWNSLELIHILSWFVRPDFSQFQQSSVFSCKPRLYRRVCPSVGWLVGWSICRSITSSFWRAETRIANDIYRVCGLISCFPCNSVTNYSSIINLKISLERYLQGISLEINFVLDVIRVDTALKQQKIPPREPDLAYLSFSWVMRETAS